MIPAVVRKNPGETVNLVIDYSLRLAVGETISSAAAAAIVGTVTCGSVTHGNTTVTVPVIGGADGETATIRALATTSMSEILAAVVDVPVSNRDF